MNILNNFKYNLKYKIDHFYWEESMKWRKSWLRYIFGKHKFNIYKLKLIDCQWFIISCHQKVCYRSWSCMKWEFNKNLQWLWCDELNLAKTGLCTRFLKFKDNL